VQQGLLIGALTLGLAVARAAAAAGVEVEVAEACTRVDRAQLTRLLNIEQRRDASAGVAHARVSVTCEGEAVTLRVEQRGDGSRPRTRTLSVADVTGEVGARVLSLSAIELLNARAPAEPEPVRAVRPEPNPVRPPAAARARLPAPSVRLMAVGTARSFELDHPLAGGGLSVDYLRLAGLGLRLEFDVAIAERRYEMGSAHVQLTTLAAQAGYLALHDAWSARAFVGYRFGAGRIAGTTDSGVVAPVGTVAGACGGPLISGGLGLRSGSWVGELGGELGLVSFPLEGRVAGHDPVALDGYWLGATLNVGVLL
jgi:hypothetical protein